jgi:uncharacterized protein (DUF1499 family)
MRRAGAVSRFRFLLVVGLLVGACEERSDPSALPSPGDVVHLLSEGNRGNVASTSEGATDPRLRPHVYPMSPVQVAHTVVDAVERMPRWEIVAGRDGVIWATRRSRIFSLVDDIYLLLLPAHDSTAVFARSASRVSKYDLGQNRRNLAELWEALERQIREAPSHH